MKSYPDEKYGEIFSSSESDPENQDNAGVGDHPLYFNEDRDVPIFHSGKCTYTTEEIVKILWSATDDLLKCKKPPKKFR